MEKIKKIAKTNNSLKKKRTVSKLNKKSKSSSKLIVKSRTSKSLNKRPRVIKKTSRIKSGIERETTQFFIKPQDNPIISPREENNWEAWQTFNPAAINLDNKIHFLYRAIGNDGVSRFGYAASDDGFKISERLNFPVYEHYSPNNYDITSKILNSLSYFSGGSFKGAEDPRIVRVDNEDNLYLVYTALDNGIRVGLTSIKLNDFLNKNWKWKKPKLISPPNEIHKNWVIFPEKIKNKYAILHSLSPEISITYLDDLEFRNSNYLKSYYNGQIKSGKNQWESWLKGVGPIPLKTKYGWLIFYHALEKEEFNKYKVGAMLLDLNNPTQIIARANKPVLEPDADYENNGYKPGIVYASGAVIKDDNLLVYYGGSDSYVCVAYADFEEFLGKLIKHEVPQLTKKEIVKKQK